MDKRKERLKRERERESHLQAHSTMRWIRCEREHGERGGGGVWVLVCVFACLRSRTNQPFRLLGIRTPIESRPASHTCIWKKNLCHWLPDGDTSNHFGDVSVCEEKREREKGKSRLRGTFKDGVNCLHLYSCDGSVRAEKAR